MKRKPLLTLFSLVLGLLGSSPLAHAQITAFTYQGKLVDDCCPATGLYDMRFKVFDALGGGSQQSFTLLVPAVPVTNGLFSVPMNFGTSPFTGGSRWLEIDVRTNNPAASYVTLSPRTELTPTPYAFYAQTAGTVINGAITGAQLAPSAVTSNHLEAGAVTSAKIANGAVGSAQLKPPISLSGSAVGGILTGNQAVLNVTNTATGAGFNFGLIAGGKTAIAAFSPTGKSAYLAINLHAGRIQWGCDRARQRRHWHGQPSAAVGCPGTPGSRPIRDGQRHQRFSY